MGVRRRLIPALLALALIVAGAGCKKKPPPEPQNQEAPVDHLAPEEVVEGAEKAFGLPLPRNSRIAAQFKTSADVVSSVSPEQLANFVRKRVTDGSVVPGTTSTKLENVVPRDDKNKRLTIIVRGVRSGDGSRSEMVIEDVTPPPFDPSLTEDQRWRKAGLVPGGGGALVDPKHLE